MTDFSPDTTGIHELEKFSARGVNRVMSMLSKKLKYFDSLEIGIRLEIKKIISISVDNFFTWFKLPEKDRNSNIDELISVLPYNPRSTISLTRTVEIIQASLQSFERLISIFIQSIPIDDKSSLTLLFSNYSQDIAFKLAANYAKDFEIKQDIIFNKEKDFFQFLNSYHANLNDFELLTIKNKVVDGLNTLKHDEHTSLTLVVGKLKNTALLKYSISDIFYLLKKTFSLTKNDFVDPNNLIGFIDNQLVILSSEKKFEQKINFKYLSKLIEIPLLVINEIDFNFEDLAHNFSELDNYIKAFNAYNLISENHLTYVYESDLVIELAILGVKKAQKQLLNNFIRPLIDTKDHLLTTLQKFLQNDSNISKTAEMLQVHQNSIRYRLDKIHKNIGLNPRNSKDAFVLQFCLIIFLLNKQN